MQISSVVEMKSGSWQQKPLHHTGFISSFKYTEIRTGYIMYTSYETLAAKQYNRIGTTLWRLLMAVQITIGNASILGHTLMYMILCQ